MRVAIEAQRIFRKKKHGMDIVALEFIRHLQQIDKENDYYIFVKPDEDDNVLQETPNFKIIQLPGGPYPYWEQVLLPRAVKKYRCELLHCTSNTAPLFCSVPLVLTLHDIIFLEKSILGLIAGEGSYYQKFGNVYRHLVVPSIVRRAIKIITVSNYENQRIAEFFDIKTPSLVKTIYNGVGEHFQTVTDAGVLDVAHKKYQLPERYMLFFGNTHPKKNTVGVLHAFALYKEQYRDDIKLVMIDYEMAELKKQLSALNNDDLLSEIVLLGYVSNKDLPALYSMAQIFLYPSLRESFGIPIIEAMACGAPVITSNTSSMPEVAGVAAYLINPYVPEEIADAMKAVLHNEVLKQNMIASGYKQAAAFTWKATAAAVLDVYRSVLNN